VDFNGLDYISSAGLRAILATAKILKGKGGHVRFANVKGTVNDVFEMSWFDSIFPKHESVAAALSAIG
jgi:stage II sporulation protein AA (anti-sigma F factor antagonist)